MDSTTHRSLDRASLGGVLIATGIVFGDIGTSPLYTMKAVINEKTVITEALALGTASCVLWTLLLLTTIKYVVIALKAENKGEGGILSLYKLIRSYRKWLLFPAVVGGSFMLADGIITPPISVSSAIEGLLPNYPNLPLIPIVIAILIALFLIQRAGTSIVGILFGPIMLIWFTMIGVIGFSQILTDPAIVRAINPYYAYKFITEYPDGFWMLGGVFLCTTGAEALYSDLGHVGRKNIQISWVYIKTCLVLCYLGQAAWLITYAGRPLGKLNPFYGMVADWFLIPSIVIATIATIIASQALISGAFSLIAKAMRLDLWPKVNVIYPSIIKGQLFIPSINYLLMVCCICVVLYFEESKNMEAAFGLSVTLTMLTTTILLATYLHLKKNHWTLVALFAFVFISIEFSYLVANLKKFANGGWATIAIGIIISTVMYIWYKAKIIKHNLRKFVDLKKYVPVLTELSNDHSVPKFATNLVYLTSSSDNFHIEEEIVYSILQKRPKRADLYWFVHIESMDEPYHVSYKVDIIKPEEIIRVKIRLGFRVSTKINYYFRKIVEEMVQNNEVNIKSRYTSLIKHNVAGDFRFVVIKRFLSFDNELTFKDDFILQFYFLLKKFSLPDEEEYGLDYSNVTVEKHPLILLSHKPHGMIRDFE